MARLPHRFIRSARFADSAVVPVAAVSPVTHAVRCALLLGIAGNTVAQQVPIGGTQTLSEIQVVAAQDRAATENSGSYTTRSMSSATRLGLSIRETPQSVSVVTRQRMDDMGLTSLAEVLVQTTGITVQENDSERTNFYARGFSIGNYQIDGVAVNSGSNALFDTAVYDRIEIVRGATGLVSGNGDPSATINMLHKRPGKEVAGSAGLTIGSWSKYRVEGDISAPLNADGSIRGRAVVVEQHRKSYLDFYKERKVVGAIIVEADLGANTMLTAGIDYQRNTPKGTTWGTTPLFFEDGTPANLPRSFNVAADWSSWERSFQNAYVYLEHRLANDWKLKAAYGRLDSSSNGKLFYGGSGYPRQDGTGLVAWTGAFPYEEKQDNLDLSANGTFSLLGRRHDLSLGVNGWKRVGTTATTSINFPSLPANQQTYAIPNIYTWNGKAPDMVVTNTGASDVATTEQYGAYLAARFNLGDRFKVMAGTRLSKWKTYSDNFNTGDVFTKRGAAYETKDVLTPYAGFIVDVSKNTSLYASYTDLFKPQNLKDKNNAFLDPITGSNLEAGIKSEFFDGKLNASLAVYQAKQDNLGELDNTVAPGFVLPDGGSAYVSSGQGTKSSGFEAEVSGMLARGWQMTGGFTRNKSTNANGDTINTIQPINMLRLSSTYRLPGAWKEVTVGGGLNWQNDIYTTATLSTVVAKPAPKVKVAQSGYTLVNLMGRYQINGQLSASVNVNNLFDKTYFRRVGFYNGGYYGEPRSVALNLRYQY